MVKKQKKPQLLFHSDISNVKYHQQKENCYHCIKTTINTYCRIEF